MHREWVWLMPCTTCSARAGANGKVQLEATYTVPTGRCCTGVGEETCNVTTQAACTGTYAGDGTSCTWVQAGVANVLNACKGWGACCEDTETCIYKNEAECSGQTYLGDSSSCNGDPCADPSGSCCRGSVCIVTTEGNCADGNWTQGETCSAGDCPQGTGSYFIG